MGSNPISSAKCSSDFECYFDLKTTKPHSYLFNGSRVKSVTLWMCSWYRFKSDISPKNKWDSGVGGLARKSEEL